MSFSRGSMPPPRPFARSLGRNGRKPDQNGARRTMTYSANLPVRLVQMASTANNALQLISAVAAAVKETGLIGSGTPGGALEMADRAAVAHVDHAKAQFRVMGDECAEAEGWLFEATR